MSAVLSFCNGMSPFLHMEISVNTMMCYLDLEALVLIHKLCVLCVDILCSKAVVSHWQTHAYLSWSKCLPGISLDVIYQDIFPKKLPWDSLENSNQIYDKDKLK